MYSYYLPDDPNPYRYSYLPKKNSFISRHYVPDDDDDDDYYANTKNEYVLYDDFVNSNRFTAKITTNSSNNRNISSKNEVKIRKNGDFYMTNKTYSDYDSTNDKVNYFIEYIHTFHFSFLFIISNLNF
jgi:hypothetical protein